MATAALLLVAVLGVDAAAREPTVVLLRPAHPTAVAAEAIVRLRGELLAAGYTVELADVPESASVRAAVEVASRARGADAVVALFGDVPQGAGLLAVIDRASGRTITRPIPHDAEGPRSAQILSVRALELLRASFLEAALASPGAAAASKMAPAKPPLSSAARAAAVAAAAAAASVPVTPAPAAGGEASTGVPTSADGRDQELNSPAATPLRQPEALVPAAAVVRASSPPRTPPTRLALEAGGLVRGSLQGMAPAVLPLLRVTLIPAAHWPLQVRLTAAGLGTRARVTGAPGDAEVSHRLATVEALWAFRLGGRWLPFVSLGAGAVYLSAQGFAAQGGAAGPVASAWAFVADAGAGLHVALSRQLYLGVEGHLEGEAPSPVIHYLGAQLAAEGRPTLLAALSLLVWL